MKKERKSHGALREAVDGLQGRTYFAAVEKSARFDESSFRVQMFSVCRFEKYSH